LTRRTAPDPRTQALHEAGQSLWLDNITRALLDQGTLQRYITDYSITGLTSNPTIFDKAIEAGSDYDDDIATATTAGASEEKVFFELALADLRRAAELFAPVHTHTDGVDGWVSLEVSPLLVHDTPATMTITQAKALHTKAARPNVFIKIPGTPEGLPAIEECTFAGIPINVTLLFSPEQYVASAEAYLRGVERRVHAGLDPAVDSVGSVFVSRWDTAVADRVPDDLRDRLGIAEAALAYRACRELLDSPRWGRLANEGARAQRLLWASTSTKNPDAPDVLYINALAAPFTINTMPEATLHAYADHGQVSTLMAADGGDAEQTLTAFERAGIDHRALADQLQRDGAATFDKSWRSLLTSIASKRQQLSATGS